MDTTKLIDLIGNSIYHPAIDKAFKDFDVEVIDKSKVDKYYSLKSTTYGITFTFWFKEFYEKQIRKPQSEFKPKGEHEVLLYEMTFTQAKNKNFIMPFGLNFGDTAETVISKIGKKPFSKSKNLDEQRTWTFYNDLFEIMPVFDNSLRLSWLRIFGLDIADKKKIEFKNNLKLQDKNINQKNIEELLSLKLGKPTANWLKRMHDGDSLFNETNIRESADLLDNFINNLVDATKTKKASTVYSKIKNVVSGFNKLNKKNNGFVETMEREELADFIERASKLTGFVIDEGVDITEETRQW